MTTQDVAQSKSFATSGLSKKIGTSVLLLILLLAGGVVLQPHEASSTQSIVTITKDYDSRNTTSSTGTTTEDTDKHDTAKSYPRIRGLSFPYKKLPIGINNASCEWIPLPLSENHPLVSSLLGQTQSNDSISSMDAIQRAALNDTICIGQNPRLQEHHKLHLFASQDALACLQQTTLLIAGDSYNQQLFLGLAEILRGVPSSMEITHSAQRKDLVALTQQFLNVYLPRQEQHPEQQHHQQQTQLDNNAANTTTATATATATSVEMICPQACHKYVAHFAQSCAKCLNRHIREVQEQQQEQQSSTTTTTTTSTQQPGDQQQQQSHHRIVPVVGAFIHIYTAHDRDPDATWNELKAFFHNVQHPMIFNSPPSFHKDLIPRQYQNAMPADDSNTTLSTTASTTTTSRTTTQNPVYTRMVEELPTTAEFAQRVTFLDFYPLTRSCRFANCSVDGGHRARFVNRWKAQLLLNTICDVTTTSIE